MYLSDIESIEMIQETLSVTLPKKLKSEISKYNDAIMRAKYFDQLINNDVDVNTEKKVLNEITILEIDKEERNIKYRFKNKYSGLNKYKNIDNAIKESLKAVTAIKTMYNNTLLSIIIVFERYFAEILKEIIKKYPSAYLNGRTLTYSELLTHKSIEEVQEKIIEKQVEETMRKSIFEIIKDLNSKHNLGIDIKSNDYNMSFIEGYLRRNIVVHNNARVNNIYVEEMQKISKTEEKKNIGDELICNKEYISFVIDSSIYFIIYLMDKIIDNLFTNEITEFIDIAIDFGYDKIMNKEYALAREIFRLIKDNKNIDIETKIYAKINYWQCYKWDGKYEDIQDEISKFDVSAYEDIIKIAVYALRDEFDKIELILNREFTDIKQNEELAIQLEGFPVFQELRRKNFYKVLKERYSDVFINVYNKVDGNINNELDELLNN